MAQVRFLNRNRPNWLWAFSSVVLLLPLMPGGCGAVPTNPPAGGTEASTVDSSAKCNTSFYNADYAFGFDLPSTAQLVGSNQHPGAAFDAQWKVEYGIGGIWLQTGVQEVLVDLQAYGDDWASEQQANGANILYAGLVSLVNGDPGYSVVYTTSWELPGSVFQSDVFVSKHARLYMVTTLVASVDYTDAAGALMDQAVLSVCVD